MHQPVRLQERNRRNLLTFRSLLRVVDRRNYTGMLLRMRKVGIFGLAVLFAALPVMACAVPNAEMTPAERACCKKMAGQCGDMGMAKSHPCCQTTATPADFHALKTASSQLHRVSLVLFHELRLTAQTDAYSLLVQSSSRLSCTHSPPGLESLAATVLRI